MELRTYREAKETKRKLRRDARKEFPNFPKIYRNSYIALALNIIEQNIEHAKKRLLERTIEKSFYKSIHRNHGY